MTTPKDLKFTKTDEWVRTDGNIATIGVSDYAQQQLSDIVYVEIKVAVGDSVKKDEAIAAVESVKAAADVNTPMSGKVTAINEKLADTPETVNKDPYGDAWIIKIELASPDEAKILFAAEAYDKYCQERGH
jgi:glycine cleavage system H protein